MILSALRPPGNVEQMLADIQTHLFRTLGVLSARAFPPLIPVAWSARPLDLGLVDPAPLPPLRLGVAGCDDERVVVPLEPQAPLDELSRTLGEQASQPAEAAPFSIDTPAVLLALKEPWSTGEITDVLSKGSSKTRRAASAAEAVHGTVVRTFSLVTIEIEQWENTGGLRVRWAERDRRRLRKSATTPSR